MNTDAPDLISDQSRRSVLKKGALASGALALGIGGTHSVGAQGEGAQENKALMFNDEFRPNAEFRVVSGVIAWTPNVEGVQEGDVFSDYNTRIIEYTNTNEEAYFFPTDQAEVQQGEVYRLHENFSLFSDDAADQGVVSASFEPVADEDVLFASEDGQLTPGEDFTVVDGGGKVLLRASNFFGGALVRIASDVVQYTPRDVVQDTDVFSWYDTRVAEYLNTGDEFQIYVAHEAEVQEGEVYVLRDEFDITPAGGNLVTAQIERVDNEDLLSAIEEASVDEQSGNETATGNQTTGGNVTEAGNQTGG